MYLSLYRKWRPKTFDEISGQEHITSILKRQCANNRVSHAYLFCGTRGTGKTSSAKILAKAVNCENPIDGNPCNQCSSCRAIDSGSATDVLEIDAASNNRVDNVRDLRDEVVYPPTILKKRVYIIDEVHMLTDSAFNALLKTLEEPPEYVVFILATTEINELPPTIISRCIRFDFSRINTESVKNRIEFVANEENIRLDNGASELLAQLADGSMRDALSLLEACSNGYSGALNKDIIRNVLGIAGDEVIFPLLHAIATKNVPDAIEIIDGIHKSSKDISVFIDDLSMAVRDIIIDKQLLKFGKINKVNKDYVSVYDELTPELLFYISSVLEETQGRITKYAINKRVVLEMAIIKMCDRSISDSTKALAARISELEKKIALLSATGCVPQEPISLPKVAPLSPATNNVNEAVDEKEEAQVRSPFREISEVYDYLSNDMSLLSFFKMTRVFRSGDDIIVCGDKNQLNIIQQFNVQSINDAFTSVIGKRVNVIFEESNSDDDQQQLSFIDEL